MAGGVEVCAICGRELPNRWAVAGRCEADGCGAAFCALHWHKGNRLCREHGWKEEEKEHKEMNESEIKKAEVNATEEADVRERAKKELPEREKQSVLRQMAAFAATVGKGAASLVDRIRGVKDPDEAISALDAQLAANRARREPLSARFESLYSEIAAKKKVYLAAPPVRKKILELELRTLLAEYKGIERQLAVYFENERMISTVRARALELVAMGLRKLSEKDVDKLADDVDAAADAAANVSSAIRDLERAGSRSDAFDADEFTEALDGFDDASSPIEAAATPLEAAASADPFAGFDDPAPATT